MTTCATDRSRGRCQRHGGGTPIPAGSTHFWCPESRVATGCASASHGRRVRRSEAEDFAVSGLCFARRVAAAGASLLLVLVTRPTHSSPALCHQTLPPDVRQEAATYATQEAVPWPLLRRVCRALRAKTSTSSPRPWLQDLARSGGLQLQSPEPCVASLQELGTVPGA